MAVYTQVSAAELDAFWARYDLPALTGFSGISEGTENSNYKIETETQPYILTLYEKRTKREELPFFLSLMQHLAAAGVNCPVPVIARDGQSLQELANRPAAVTSFLPGRSLARGILPAHCHFLGQALGQMHNAAVGFAGERANSLSLAGWQDLASACNERASPQVQQTLQTELAFLQTHWPQDLPRGVIHADLFPDNVFFAGEQLSGLIDFYFACTDFFAYDLAICLNAWCFEDHVAFNITKARALLRGYTAIRPLSAGELTALPTLCRGAALRFLLTRLYDTLYPKGGTPRDYGQYLKRLQFHQQVDSVGAYGLETHS
jgi:homoserine kinase type II